VRSRQSKWKDGKDKTVVDTIQLASQHFHYLLLKDPFADKEQVLRFATEAFSRAFAEKDDSAFVVEQNMLSLVSAHSSSFTATKYSIACEWCCKVQRPFQGEG
jgi:hypothetical protein